MILHITQYPIMLNIPIEIIVCQFFTQSCSKPRPPATTAGPKLLAGFMLGPVIGP